MTIERLAEIRDRLEWRVYDIEVFIRHAPEDILFLLDELAKLEVDCTYFQQRLNASERSLRESLLEIDRLKSLNEWRDISTAPKDGTEIEVYGWVQSPNARWYIVGTRWCEALPGMVEACQPGYWDFRAPGYSGWINPTHWRPLPDPPEVKT